jgi:hypothetical protein
VSQRPVHEESEGIERRSEVALVTVPSGLPQHALSKRKGRILTLVHDAETSASRPSAADDVGDERMVFHQELAEVPGFATALYSLTIWTNLLLAVSAVITASNWDGIAVNFIPVLATGSLFIWQTTVETSHIVQILLWRIGPHASRVRNLRTQQGHSDGRFRDRLSWSLLAPFPVLDIEIPRGTIDLWEPLGAWLSREAG